MSPPSARQPLCNRNIISSRGMSQPRLHAAAVEKLCPILKKIPFSTVAISLSLYLHKMADITREWPPPPSSSGTRVYTVSSSVYASSVIYPELGSSTMTWLSLAVVLLSGVVYILYVGYRRRLGIYTLQKQGVVSHRTRLLATAVPKTLRSR